MYLDKLTNHFCLRKKLGYQFFVEQFFYNLFFSNLLITFELLICKINVLTTFWMVDFFEYFYSIGKYTK